MLSLSHLFNVITLHEEGMSFVLNGWEWFLTLEIGFLKAAVVLNLMLLVSHLGDTANSCLLDVFTYCKIADASDMTHLTELCSVVSAEGTCKRRDAR